MRSHRKDSVFDEAQYQRLRTLAESVNDTARMARTTIFLLLLVALYLALTLGTATDENLLRNGQVVLPQVGTGIPIVQSYIFAPLVFLLMHAHALFLLSVLARKVRTFHTTLKMELSHWRISRNEARTQEKECRNWLSGFAFVQIFQEDNVASRIACGLTWLAISAIPLTLLFVIDISFVRYQSDYITWYHHFIFGFGLGLVVLFYWEVFGQRVVKMPRRVVTWIKGLAAGAMVSVLLFAAHPPSENERPESIRTHGGKVIFEELWKSLFGSHNFLDVGPCKISRIGCRYLDVSYLPNSKDEKLILTKRILRFAKFDSAYLQGADFQEAKLKKAYFWDAQLQSAVFKGAELQGAVFENAKLQGAVFEDAELQRVDLRRAQMQRVDLRSARLQGANLRRMQLQGADLRSARLQGANLRGAQLQGAEFSFARLQGANFEGAESQGANFRSARLQCGSGEPRKWYLAWMPRARFKFSGYRTKICSPRSEELDQCIKEMIPDEITNIKPAWGESKTLKKHMRRRLEDCPERVFGGAKPDKKDMVYYERRAKTGPPNSWPDPPYFESENDLENYLNAWREWTVEFACRNVYAGRSSIRRWRRDTLGFKRRVSADAPLIVLNALAEKRNDKRNCPGIAAIPDKEWESLLKGDG